MCYQAQRAAFKVLYTVDITDIFSFYWQNGEMYIEWGDDDQTDIQQEKISIDGIDGAFLGSGNTIWTIKINLVSNTIKLWAQN